MKRICALCLILCMSVTLCACGMEIDIDLDKRDDNYVSPSVTEPVYDAPVNNDAIVQYLSNKYGGTFVHKKYDDKQETLYYTSPEYPNHLFKVCTLDALWMAGHDITGFEGEYADNGYFAVSYNAAYKYYWDLIKYIPDCILVLEYEGDVLPSAITPTSDFQTVKKQYPSYFTPTLYLIRETNMTQEEIESLKLYLEQAGEQLDVFLVLADRDEWESTTLERVKNETRTYQIRNHFTTNPTSGE